MTAQTILALRPLLDAAGWALVHSLWQGALVAALYACFSALAARSGANVRYAGGVAALALVLLLPCATAYLAARSPQGPLAPGGAAPEGAWADPAGAGGGASREGGGPAARAAWFEPPAAASSVSTLRRRVEARLAAALPWLVLA